MATATQSTTLMSRPARSLVSGVISETFSYNLGAVTASGATLIQLCKIPAGATVIDLNFLATSGAATNPADAGISGKGTYQGASGVSGTASTFVAAGTGGAVVRATKGLPWKVEVTDEATVRYATLTATVTPGTATVSLQINGTVTYVASEY